MNLSIIIPIYNTEKYLQKCLDSVFIDNHFEGEVICVNDGSTDTSSTILNEYAQKHSNLKVINQPNQGLSAARNVGVQRATGDYVLFLDSDDFLISDSIGQISNIIKENNVDVYIGNYLGEHTNSTKLSSDVLTTALSGQEAMTILMQKRLYQPMAWMYICRRRFLTDNDLLFENGLFFEDEVWTVQTLMKAPSAKALNFRHYYYRVNPHSITQTKLTPRKIESKKRIVKILRELSINATDSLREELVYRACGIQASISPFLNQYTLFLFQDIWNLNLSLTGFNRCVNALYPHNKFYRRLLCFIYYFRYCLSKIVAIVVQFFRHS